jgi:hypothetical protein
MDSVTHTHTDSSFYETLWHSEDCTELALGRKLLNTQRSHDTRDIHNIA